MSLSAEEVVRMLDATPAATVALYASLHDSLSEGRLVIGASHGRIAQFCDLSAWFGKGNVVDIPALEWLCRQRQPRTWITDGGVTGVGDKTCVTLDARAADLVRLGGIGVYTSVPEYMGRPRRG
jgi:hypothetical protein